MLLNFEEITEDLNDFEVTAVIPLICSGLKNYIGKENAISGSTIIKRINDKYLLGKYKLNSVKLRKIISAIRLRGDLLYICSSSKGYYIAKNNEELDNCIESLEQRISQQQKVVNALIWQRSQSQN